MRAEYILYQRLMWDATFRASFLAGQIRMPFDGILDVAALSLAKSIEAGLGEEAYRRISGIQRVSKELFPRSHNLLMAFGGEAVLERVLAEFFGLNDEEDSECAGIEILEPFDGYVVGPRIMESVGRGCPEVAKWVISCMEYEWAVWQARRVAMGWPPLFTRAPLVPGASLVAADFDLKGLMNEVHRLERASVAPDVYRWRIRPGAGTLRVAVFPRAGSVAEARLEPGHFEELLTALQSPTNCVHRGLATSLEEIGLVVDASFLCCSREAAGVIRVSEAAAELVEPLPH